MADFDAFCPLANLPLQKSCEPRRCESCGWNPVVHRDRIRRLELLGPRALCGPPKKEDHNG